MIKATLIILIVSVAEWDHIRAVMSWQFNLPTQRRLASRTFVPKSNRGNDPSPFFSSPQPKRRRKNKYQDFSKVDTEKDPFDSLLAESYEKQRVLLEKEQEHSQSKNPYSHTDETMSDDAPKFEFPDTKHIDPYDPTTFGYIEIATVIGAHGVRGWIKVRSTTDFGSQRLCNAGLRHLKPLKKRAPRQVTLLQGRKTKDEEYLIELKGITNRDSAQALRGSTLYVRQEDKVEPNQEEYLISDLVGLDVMMMTPEEEEEEHERKDDLFVGKVGGIVFAEDLSASPSVLAHDMLEIILPHNRKSGMASFRDELVLIPFVPQIVPRVDLAARAVYIDPPRGLLDLTYVREKKVRTKGFLPPVQ